ncbi:hypothetical protein F4774DRAFT_426679 [Daldinia eschscholtzii]|nr:hypothetical protein F4774DRAFT_426679 [Daldinia eschscholtzii]
MQNKYDYTEEPGTNVPDYPLTYERSSSPSPVNHTPAIENEDDQELEVSPSLSSDQQKREHKNRGCFRGWGLEIFSLFIAISAFISLITVLEKADNLPIIGWTFPLSLNAVVSALSVTMRTLLAFSIGSCLGQGKWTWFKKRQGSLSRFIAFDNASRGPLGCVSLIMVLESRYWASLGAWVTLLLLILDPCVQSLITYKGQVDITGQNNSRIVKATRLDVGKWSRETMARIEFVGEEFLNNYHIYSDVGIATISVLGFVNTSTSQPSKPPSVSCQTGNCTWPTYSSLGVCSACFDISEHIIKEKGSGMPDISVFSPCHDASYAFVTNYTTYSVPYNSGRPLLIQNTDGLANQSQCLPRSRVGLSAVFRPNETYRFANSTSLLASFVVLELQTDYWDSKIVIEDSTPKATECALEYCGRIYEAVVRNGDIVESTILESTSTAIDSFQPLGKYSQELIDVVQREYGNSVSDITLKAFAETNNFPTLLERNDLQVEIPITANVPEHVQRVFNITQTSIVTMMRTLADSTTLESITYALSNSTNVTTSFDNAAHLLSNRMREIDGSMAYGSSEQWVIYTHVQWRFFALPIVVVVAGCLFVIGTILDSTRLQLETKKTDLLSTLITVVDPETRAFLRKEKRGKDKDEDKVLAKVDKEEDGLVLRFFK